ncbi:MAG: transketolase [Planctomycetota bacterium]|jgi:transketolase
MNQDAKSIRERILDISYKSGHGHIPTCFSVVEMMLAVFDTMRHDPANPRWEGRDIFILSKGHAALAHFCILAHYGYFPIERVFAFGSHKSDFGCHADRFRVPGIEASTGSLGHGIGLAAGIALAFKIEKNDRKAYVLIGDGESNEGTVWEAVMVAVHLGLDNLTILYDNNGSQIRCQPIPNPAERFAAFGCQTIQVNGHNVDELKKALAVPQSGVKAIVADTVKGYGCRTLIDNMFAWHRRSPNEDELKELLEELNEIPV